MIFQKIILSKMKILPKLLNKNIKHSYAKIFPKKVLVGMVINADLPTENMN